MYRYSVFSTGESSAAGLGVCQVCGKPCSEVFHLSEERQYKLLPSIAKARGEEFGWTHHDCQSLFGHESCMRAQKR
jgi:hypothetical protein